MGESHPDAMTKFSSVLLAAFVALGSAAHAADAPTTVTTPAATPATATAPAVAATPAKAKKHEKKVHHAKKATAPAAGPPAAQ